MAVTEYLQSVLFQLAPPEAGEASWRYTPLHIFEPGHFLTGGITLNDHGSVFSTIGQGGTEGGGAVFKLERPEAGGQAWNKQLIANFGYGTMGSVLPGGTGNLRLPQGLSRDAQGNLYGAMNAGIPVHDGGGGYNGKIFELKKPPESATQWVRQTILTFAKPGTVGVLDPFSYAGSLVFDAEGNAYGHALRMSPDGGIIYTLTRPANGGGPWQQSVIYELPSDPKTSSFDPQIIMDAAGNIYGTKSQDTGTGATSSSVFELKRPTSGTARWTETEFLIPCANCSMATPLVIDAAGDLFCGKSEYTPNGIVSSVVELQPRAGSAAWAYSTIVRVQMPAEAVLGGGLVIDRQGRLFGTTFYGLDSTGTIFEILP